MGINDGTCIDEPIVLERRTQIKRLGKETKLVVGGQVATAQIDPALVKAVVKAHRWFDMLKNGVAPSIAAIAKQEGLQRSYVSSLMPLAFLAPEITEAILKGAQPVELTLDR